MHRILGITNSNSFRVTGAHKGDKYNIQREEAQELRWVWFAVLCFLLNYGFNFL